jgi:hypothetical protein
MVLNVPWMKKKETHSSSDNSNMLHFLRLNGFLHEPMQPPPFVCNTPTMRLLRFWLCAVLLTLSCRLAAGQSAPEYFYNAFFVAAPTATDDNVNTVYRIKFNYTKGTPKNDRDHKTSQCRFIPP